MWDATPPPFALLVVGILGLTVAFACTRYGRRLALGLPLWALVGIQGFRLPLELAMHAMYERGVMPEQMSYSGRNFDIVTGITALVVAWLAFSGRVGRRVVLTWNIRAAPGPQRRDGRDPVDASVSVVWRRPSQCVRHLPAIRLAARSDGARSACRPPDRLPGAVAAITRPAGCIICSASSTSHPQAHHETQHHSHSHDAHRQPHPASPIPRARACETGRADGRATDVRRDTDTCGRRRRHSSGEGRD